MNKATLYFIISIVFLGAVLGIFFFSEMIDSEVEANKKNLSLTTTIRQMTLPKAADSTKYLLMRGNYGVIDTIRIIHDPAYKAAHIYDSTMQALEKKSIANAVKKKKPKKTRLHIFPQPPYTKADSIEFNIYSKEEQAMYDIYFREGNTRIHHQHGESNWSMFTPRPDFRPSFCVVCDKDLKPGEDIRECVWQLHPVRLGYKHLKCDSIK